MSGGISTNEDQFFLNHNESGKIIILLGELYIVTPHKAARRSELTNIEAWLSRVGGLLLAGG